MMLQTKLQKIAEALVDGLTVTPEGSDTGVLTCQVYHYWRPNMTAPFVVWAEDGEDISLNADDRKQEQAITGYVDYYTKLEFDERVDAIQAIFYELQGEIPFGWRLDSVQYEEDTNLIHFQWTWVV